MSISLFFFSIAFGPQTKQNVTVTTVGSSWNSDFSQPLNDVFHFDGSDFASSPDFFQRDFPETSHDPSRIQRCLDVPYNSELGEI